MLRRWLAVLLLLPACAGAASPARVYAAASLTNALTEIAGRWVARGHPEPRLVFAGSATLARQLAAGAPADVFVSADEPWMDELERAGDLVPSSRLDLLGNSLVVIAPRGAAFRAEMRPGFPFASAFRGRLCLGEPGMVPAGTYAREALQALGFWDALRRRVVGTDDVRAALTFVERGECAAGVVYATDARASDRVEVVAVVPSAAHRPIRYPAAVLARATAGGREFFSFLAHSREAAAIFERHGFRYLGTNAAP